MPSSPCPLPLFPTSARWSTRSSDLGLLRLLEVVEESVLTLLVLSSRELSEREMRKRDEKSLSPEFQPSPPTFKSKKIKDFGCLLRSCRSR